MGFFPPLDQPGRMIQNRGTVDGHTLGWWQGIPFPGNTAQHPVDKANQPFGLPPGLKGLHGFIDRCRGRNPVHEQQLVNACAQGNQGARLHFGHRMAGKAVNNAIQILLPPQNTEHQGPGQLVVTGGQPLPCGQSSQNSGHRLPGFLKFTQRLQGDQAGGGTGHVDQ